MKSIYSRTFILAILASTALMAIPAFAQETKVPATVEATSPVVGDFSAVVKKIRPAVVSITAHGISANSQEADDEEDIPDPPARRPRGPNQVNPLPFPLPVPPVRRSFEARGSGFIVDPSGYIVTNNHVVKNASSLSVTLDDGTELPAVLMGHDARSDLAVLKVVSSSPLPSISFGDSDNVQPGQWVIAMGNPFGLGGSVTAGIISARGRDIGEGPYDSFIQVDAPINQGNSGGPLFSADGKVIGINTAIYSPSGGSVGIGFAIPSNVLVAVLTQLEHGERVERGFIGVSMQPINKELAKAFGLKNTNGALVNELAPDGPANKAGLKAGDIITSVNGKAINTPRELAINIGSVKPESDVKVTVLREGEEKTIIVKIGILPSSPEEEKEQEIQKPASDLGVLVGPNTDKTLGGVLITGVRPGSTADRAGIHVGDVLLGVGGKNFSSIQDAKSSISGVTGTIALHISRDGHTLFIPVELKAKPPETKPEVKPEAKQEVKPEAKSEQKPIVNKPK